MIRLVALDLDGTLLGPDWKVGEADKEAIAAALERGVHIVIDTTRWYEIALRTARRLGLTAPMVCHNGAHIKSPESGDELLHRPIATEVAREIAAFCDERQWETYTTIAGVTYMRTRWQAQIDPARLPQDMRVAATHAEHVTGPATGIMAFGEDAIRDVPEAFAARYEGALAFPLGWSESQQPYVTVTVAGVDKGTGLRAVCEHLGVPLEEAMAMGDAQPDVAMFEVEGIGVAMGNAIDDVKAQADAVAPSNTEGGVAWAIRRYVLEES
jgi:Cof subfamily protein (haloacid dehalogenase superfamily)